MSAPLSRKTREALLGYLLVLPSLLLFATFAFYPFIKDFWLGLYRSPPFAGPRPVGRDRPLLGHHRERTTSGTASR